MFNLEGMVVDLLLEVWIYFFYALLACVPAAIILRAAIWGNNKMTGGGDSPTSVPKLSMGKAIGISFFALLCISIVTFPINPVLIWGRYGAFIAILTPFLISVLVMAGMLRFFLPTTFKSATRVALSWTLIISALLGLWKLVPSEWFHDYFRNLFGFVLITVTILAVAIIRRATIREANKTTGGDDSPTPVPKPSSGKTIVRTFVAILCIVIATFAIFVAIVLLLNPYTWMAIPVLFFFVLFVGVPTTIIATIIAGIILRVAIWGDNKMAGGRDSPTPVPKPSIGKTIRISFFAMLCIMIATFAGLPTMPLKLLGMFSGPINPDEQMVALGSHALSYSTFKRTVDFLLSSVLVMTGMLRFVLPITFMPAIRVAVSFSLMNCALLGLLYPIYIQVKNGLPFLGGLRLGL
tara:strand:+ start:24 stop:1247 length:1224 start_codon:yes stop_codon:yes gene_type:complete